MQVAHQERSRRRRTGRARDRAPPSPAASAPAPCRSAPATPAAARRGGRRSRSSPAGSGRAGSPAARQSAVLRHQLAELLAGTRRRRGPLRSIAPASISVTSVRKPDVLLPERHQQQHQLLAHARRRPRRPCRSPGSRSCRSTTSGSRGAGRRGRTRRPGSAGSRTRAAGAPPPCARGPSGASRIGTPWISSITSSRDGREVVVHAGTSEPRSTAASTSRIRSMFAASCRKSSSRCSDVDRCSNDGAHVDHLPERRAVGRLLGEQLQQPEVLHDVLAARSGRWTFTTTRVAARQRRPVHLGDRAGGERLRVDRLEHVLPRDAELLLHHRRRPAPR